MHSNIMFLCHRANENKIISDRRRGSREFLDRKVISILSLITSVSILFSLLQLLRFLLYCIRDMSLSRDEQKKQKRADSTS